MGNNQQNCCGDIGERFDEVTIGGTKPTQQTPGGEHRGDEVFERAADENGIWARIDKL